MKRFGRLAAALCMAVICLAGCGGVTEEMKASREAGIAMMETGDYEGAVAQFNSLVAEADSVTEFELDILKYRAEAEFLLGDYEAAAYTYDILKQVDGEQAEYYYFSAMALAKSGDTAGAKELLAAGKALDEKMEKPGYADAAAALGAALSESGDVTGAEAVYEELILSGHATTEIYNRLMVAAMEAGEYEEALEISAQGQQLTDGLAIKELKFNEAVCREYLGEFETALELFQGYVEEFGSDERAEHEIAFLVTR